MSTQATPDQQANYIKTLRIKGFKKFTDLTVDFNPNVNIIAGENGSGKSTILEAIKIVLNQQNKNSDRSLLEDWFNVEAKEAFQRNPCIKTLPEIEIEVELCLSSSTPKSINFHGEYHSQKREAILNKSKRKNEASKERYGITFKCFYDATDNEELNPFIEEGNLPYEHYTLEWTTFAHLAYQAAKPPLNIISINTSEQSTTTSFNQYNRTLFLSKYDDKTIADAKNCFRHEITRAFNKLSLEEIDKNSRFGIDNKKLILEKIISIYQGNILLENQGSGQANLIKTQIALSKSNKIDTLLIEEPENHLSPTTLNRMISDIEEKKKNHQIIITTHSNTIASRLNLKNVLWIAGEQMQSLRDIKKETARFFEKLPSNSFLILLLSKKIILVEGPTEYLLLPMLYQRTNNSSIEKDEVVIISCNGISYQRYLDIAEKTGKKLLVLTDNDKKLKKIQEKRQTTGKSQRVYMSDDIEEWTWEVCLYKLNKIVLDRLFKNRIKTTKAENEANVVEDDLSDGKNSPTLQWMLEHKSEAAYAMSFLRDDEIEVPQYIQEALRWIKE